MKKDGSNGISLGFPTTYVYIVNLFMILGMANMQVRNDGMLFLPCYTSKESSFAHIRMHAEICSNKSDIL